jgi:ArsR family metal-binding transcriptional regulator
MSVGFLQSIALDKTLPCLADPGKIIVVGSPSRDLSEVIPYLATLPNAVAYDPQSPSLTLRRNPGLITVQAERVSITQVADADEGVQLLGSLAEAINATWDHRAQLVAATTRRQAPRPLDVWEFLPQTNCRRCGELTCMAFAFSLLLQRRTIGECETLVEDHRFAERRNALDALLSR